MCQEYSNKNKSIRIKTFRGANTFHSQTHTCGSHNITLSAQYADWRHTRQLIEKIRQEALGVKREPEVNDVIASYVYF